MNRANLPKPVEWAITFFVSAFLFSLAVLVVTSVVYVAYLVLTNMRSW